MPTKPEDVSVAWGQARSQADMVMERWWHAIYQDMVPSNDGSRLYFLYDQSVENNGNYQCITIFDPQAKRFLRDLPLNIREGRVKYFYLVQPDQLALFVQNQDRSGGNILWVFSIRLSPDGLSIVDFRPVIQSLSVGEDWIICQAQDTVALISGPGLQVWRMSLQGGILYSYTVPGANVTDYFDATVFGGVIYLFPGNQAENVEFNYVHTIDMEGKTPMRPFSTRPDPVNGYPAVRKQCATDTWQGRLFVAGGQFDDPSRGTWRFGDVWALDLRYLQWQRLIIELPLLIVEPRMTILDSGLCYLWGDCDVSAGCYTNRRHFHVMRMYAGVPPLQEMAWQKFTRMCPQILRYPIEQLRDFYRLPEKFLYRVYQSQMIPQQQAPSNPQSGHYGGQGASYVPPPAPATDGQYYEEKKKKDKCRIM